MDKRELRDQIRLERSELLSLLESLTPREWEVPSLCEGWLVRDVVAHLVAYDRFDPSLALHFVKARFSVDRVNVRTAAAWRSHSTDALLDRLRRNLVPGGITRVIGWRVELQDAVVHQQDVRRPLDRPRVIPPERLVAVLGCLVDPPFLSGVPMRADGLRLNATDLDWSWGERGAEVSGSGEALVMALAGRTATLDELDGPGVALLRERSTT